MSFNPADRDRENLPCFPRSIVGHLIECHHQSGIMRLLKDDRVRIEEIRHDHALVTHAGLKGGVLLVAINQLAPIPEETQPEDALL